MATNQQQAQDILNQYRLEELRKKRANNMQMPITAYSTLSKIGRTGQAMQGSSNPLVSNIGSKLYKYSGREYMDGLKQGAYDKVNSMLTPQQSGTMTNTIANSATPSSNVAPTISNFGTNAGTIGAGTGTGIGTGVGTGVGTGIGTGSALGTGVGGVGAGLEGAGLGTFGTAAAGEATGAGSMGLAGLGNVGANVATTAGGSSLAGAGAGTGAALGGSTAAGAAGGGAALGAAGAGSAAAAAVPIVGWAVAAASLIYNMIRSAKQKKDMEALNKNLQAGQENKQLSDQQTQEAMQNLDTITNQQNQGVQGQLPELPGVNMSQNQQPVDRVPVQASPASPVEPSTPNVNEVVETTQPQTNTNPADVLSGNIKNEQPQDNKNLKDNLMSFFGDAGRGFSENNSTPISLNNLTQQTYATPEHVILPTNQDVDAYAEKLRNDGIKEDVINAFLTEGKNSGNKDIAEWVNSHQGMRDENGNWKPTEIEKDVEHKKGLGYRLGEAIGTGHRILSNPLTQGLITTGAYMLDGETPWYSLGKGYEMASNKARSDAYRRMITKDNSASLFGGYSEKDLNAHTNQLWRDGMLGVNQQRADNDTSRVEGQRERWNTQNKNDTLRTEGQVNRWNSQNKTDQQKADAVSARTGAYVQKIRNDIETKNIKPEQHPSFAGDLAQFREVYLSTNDKAIRDKCINKFIRAYRVDPRKYLKDKIEE